MSFVANIDIEPTLEAISDGHAQAEQKAYIRTQPLEIGIFTRQLRRLDRLLWPAAVAQVIGDSKRATQTEVNDAPPPVQCRDEKQAEGQQQQNVHNQPVETDFTIGQSPALPSNFFVGHSTIDQVIGQPVG